MLAGMLFLLISDQDVINTPVAPWDSSFKCCEWGTRTSPSSTESLRYCIDAMSAFRAASGQCMKPFPQVLSKNTT